MSIYPYDQGGIKLGASGIAPGNVILFHDAGGDRSQTAKALEEILPALKKEGYEFVTVSTLLNKNGIEVSR